MLQTFTPSLTRIELAVLRLPAGLSSQFDSESELRPALRTDSESRRGGHHAVTIGEPRSPWHHRPTVPAGHWQHRDSAGRTRLIIELTVISSCEDFDSESARRARPVTDDFAHELAHV